MKKAIILLVAGVVFTRASHAQFLVEHFNYNNGSLGASGIGSTVWTAGDSPSTAIQVNSTAALTNAFLADIAVSGIPK